MIRKEIEQADLLDGYWQDLQRGPAVAPPAGLDPQLAATARRLVAGLRRLEPAASFVTRLERELAGAAGVEHTPRPARQSSMATRRAAELRRVAARWWPLVALAAGAAAILLLALRPRPDMLTVAGPRHAPRPSQPGAVLGPLPPFPEWQLAGPPLASDQGVTLALLSGMVQDPRYLVLFVVVDAGPELGEARIVMADLKIVDGDGRERPCEATWLESAGGVTLGAVTVRKIGPGSPLQLRASEMRIEPVAGDEARALRGGWVLGPFLRLNPDAATSPDLVEPVGGGLECFRTAGVAIQAHTYSVCDGAAAGPGSGSAQPAATATAAAAPSPTTAPAQALPAFQPGATATPPAASSPPGPAGPLPGPTSTPAVALDFWDREGRGFGAILTMSAPQPHWIYVLVDGEGHVRRVGEQEFMQARDRAVHELTVQP